MTSSVLTKPARPVAGDLRDGLPVTFVVLTKDEERCLPACLDSLAGVSDDVHVLDSGSTDGTVETAIARDVPVYSHPFRGFGTQRNWAIDHIPHRYEWVFHLDADERMTLSLAQEIGRALSTDPSEAGYFVPSKLLLHGHWLRYAGGYPTFQVRLFHRRRLRFADHGHGQRETTAGQVGYLREPYLHDAFSKGVDHWFAKHAIYARREAEEHALAGPILRDLAGILQREPVARRRALKRLSFRLPGRSTLRFWETMVVRRAFLDGRAGIAYAKMLAAYEAMVAAQLELQRSSRSGSNATPFGRAGELPPGAVPETVARIPR